jgi:hypothetical protein
MFPCIYDVLACNRPDSLSFHRVSDASEFGRGFQPTEFLSKSIVSRQQQVNRIGIYPALPLYLRKTCAFPVSFLFIGAATPRVNSFSRR